MWRRKRKYKIDRPESGVLTYREGGTEFTFPIYDEDGEVVFVAWPTRQRLFLYFSSGGWTRVPSLFSRRDRERITEHVVEHFEREGARFRVVTRPESDERGLQFHPELFDCKARAAERLDAAGFFLLNHYGSIDLLQEEFGLEVCGIREDESVEPIAQVLLCEFPQWHYNNVRYQDYGREPGWKLRIHMFPPCCEGDCCGGDD